MRNLIVTLLFLFFSAFSNAASYLWTVQGAGFHTGSSPLSAANAAVSANNWVRVHSCVRSSDTSFLCTFETQTGGFFTKYPATRSGDSCPNADDVYNSQTGECEPPPPDCSNVSPGIFKTPNGPVHTVNGRRIVAARLEGPVCYNSCEYDITKTVSCYLVPGSTDTGFCNALGQGNGNNCSAPDAALGSTGDQLNPPPETPDPDEPPSDPDDPGCHGIPGYVWNGTTCVKAPTGDGDGGDNGGNNGGNNGGGNNGGGDGGGDNGGNNGGGDGSGNGDGDGDGNNGGNTGGGNGNGNGSGNGNGNGNGDGDGEGSGGPGGAGVPGVCEDGICQFEEPEGFGDGEAPGFGESLEQVFKGIQESPIGQAVTDISFPSGGTCPVSSVSLFNTNITFDSHCDLWAQIAPILSAVFLAVWALLAVRIFLSA